MLRFVVRRNWIRLIAWTVAIVGLFAYVEVYYRGIFTTQKALDQFAAVSNVPSIKALTGLAAAPNTLGGAVWTKIWMSCVVLLAFVVVFLVTRNGRADEEAGRTELLRSRALGLSAYSAASYTVAVALCLIVAAGITVASIAGRLDPAGSGVAGSVVLGASTAGVGIVAVALAAAVGQCVATSRAANGICAAVLGLFYMLRMIGDVGGNGLSWLSPIGWGEQMEPWGADRWWPLIFLIVTAVVLFALAFGIEQRRDLGSALVGDRPGPPEAPRRYATPLGLALRLQRWPVVGWLSTVVLTALLFGSVVKAMTSLLADASDQIVSLVGGRSIDALLAMLVSLLAMVTTAFALQAVTSLRVDEANGTIEAQLAGALSRTSWLVQRLVVPILGSGALLAIGGALVAVSYGLTSDAQTPGSLILAAIAYWPAVLVFIGVAVALFGWLPRVCLPATWALFTATWVVVLFGEALHIPSWAMSILPMSATPHQPLEPMSWPPLLALTTAAIVLLCAGFLGFRRRDVQRG